MYFVKTLKTEAFTIKMIRVLANALLSLLALVTVCFFVMHAVPGDPFQDEQGVPEEVIASIRHKWGLDHPLPVQYCCYLNQILHGNLGYSMRYPSESIAGIIANGFSISIVLGLQALSIAIPLGIALGTLSACKANQRFDILTTVASTLGVSVPSFVIAAIFQLFFALYIPIFPVARWGTISHTILPSLALALGPTCGITRMVRSSVLDTLTKDWVVTARMKGLPEWKVIVFHVIPNAMLPILHYLGPTTANLLVGSFVVERVFGIPGLGQWFVNGVMTRDYPVITGLTLFYSCILFSVHSIIDIITSALNARIAHQEAAR
jgi:ABC-type dipeptide/oligopeptide/nickel transport system permease component